MSENKIDNQLTLFSAGGILDAATSGVFEAQAIKNAKGSVVGTAVKMIKRSTVAESMNLKGKANKDKLDTVILEQRDAMFRRVKGDINALDGNWTHAKLATRTLGNGIKQITWTIQEIERAKAPDIATMARTLGLSEDEIKELMAEVAKRELAKDVGGEAKPE